MTAPNYKLKNDHVATCGHVRTLYQKVVDEFRSKADSYDRTYIDDTFKDYLKKNGMTQVTGTLTYATGPIISDPKDIPSYHIVDLMVQDRVAKEGDTMTGPLVLSGAPTLDLQATTKKYVDDQDATKKTIGTFDDKIQHASTNSGFHCSNPNNINIKVNGHNRGYFFQPTGQATTPLGLFSNDKLQLQSALSSSSVYGSKPLSTDGSLNTHGLYVGGIDDSSKNVQSMVQVYQGTATGTLSAGHANLGAGQQNFTALSADSALLLSGGVPLQDPQIQMYSTSRATQLATSLPIQVTGKMGYASAITVDQPQQFTSKTYVDSAVSGVPVADLTPYVKKDGSVAMTGVLNMGTNKIQNLTTGTLTTDSVNLGYVQGEVSTLQGQITNLSTEKISQSDGDLRYLKLAGGTLTGILNAGNNKIQGVSTAVSGTDAVNLTQLNGAFSGYDTTATLDNRYYAKTVPLNSITQATGAVSLNSQKITSLAAPTVSTDGATKGYVDTAIASISGSNPSQIVSADSTKKVVANNSSIDFQNNSVAHLSIFPGQAQTTSNNYDISSTSSTAVSNKFTFKSTGVSNQAQFYALNFSDGGDRKTRVGSSGTGSSDVYVDLSLTNQQVQIPSSAKLIRADTSTTNFSNQEYVTKAYASSLISGTMTAGDGSQASIANNAVFSVQTSDTTKKINLQTSVGEINQDGNSTGLLIKAKPDTSSSGGSLQLLSTANGDLHSMFNRAAGYSGSSQAITDARQFPHKQYVDTAVATKVSTGASISTLGVPTANFGMGNYRLTDLGNPVNAQDAATRQWVLDQLSGLGLSSYPSSYTIRINIGDIPSSIESLSSTGDQTYPQIAQQVYYDSGTPGGNNVLIVNLNGMPFGNGNYEILTQTRSNRSFGAINQDNDLTYILPFSKGFTQFSLFFEETYNVVQDVSIICVLVPGA